MLVVNGLLHLLDLIGWLRLIDTAPLIHSPRVVHTFLTLPAGRMPALGRHPALRPQHGPSAHLWQTSRSIEPLWSFGKPQEEKPMDVTQRIQWES